MKKLIESELNNPVLCVSGRFFTLKEAVEKKEVEKKRERVGVPAIVERVKKGEKLKNVLAEDDLYRLCIERYKINMKKPNSESIRINIFGVGSFSFKEIVEHLEKRTEVSKKFVDAMCKYLEWLIKRAGEENVT